MKFFAELKRRHIYRVAAAYAVVAWVLIQLVNNVAPALKLPDWTVTLVIVLLAVGFPIVLIFAWAHELGASPAGGTPSHATTNKLDWTLIGALVAVLAMVSYQQLAPTTVVRTAQQQANVASTAAPAAKSDGISIAVLPFVNLSGDVAQEFFSDGMTEEITSALAKVPGWLVVGRTSAFQFKGENKDLTAIGQALHATHLIEGSVRKDGNEVRITAQLIRADNGTHLWTESYNRELKGVFAVQEEIATAIAASLRVPLGLKAGESLVSNRTTDTDSYQDYLRAKALVRGRGALEPGGPLTEAARLLEQVTARDPNYAPAWALLGYAYSLAPIYTAAFFNGSIDELRRVATDAMQKAEAAAQQATRLDPNSIDGYIALGYAQSARGRFIQAEDLYRRALALDPGNPDAIHRFGLMLATAGHLMESLPLRLRLQAQEPFVPTFNVATGMVLWESGRNDDAVTTYRAQLPSVFSRVYLAQVYASVGRYSEAADALREVPPGTFSAQTLTEAARLLRSAPGESVPPRTAVSNGVLGFVYAHTGASDRVLDFYERIAETGYPGIGDIDSLIWAPAYAPARKTDRFKAYARKVGLVDYWRARGWPDLCRPMGTDDFVCD